MKIVHETRCGLHVLIVVALLVLGGCDDSTTTTYTECYQDQSGHIDRQRCCTTRCTYDNDCYYYYGDDCDVYCTKTCYDNSATPVSTVVYVTPGTRPPMPTPTPSPSPGLSTRIDVGSTIARPGDQAILTVSLGTPVGSVAATGNDISFDPRVLGLEPSACSINPTIGKSLVASVVRDEGSTKTLRIFVSSNGNANPIPNGSLYTCTFAIASSALPGTYPVSNSGALAFAPDGTAVRNVVGVGGSVTVSLVVFPSPTARATRIP